MAGLCCCRKSGEFVRRSSPGTRGTPTLRSTDVADRSVAPETEKTTSDVAAVSSHSAHIPPANTEIYDKRVHKMKCLVWKRKVNYIIFLK
jgi:hypothetical protein